VSLDCSVTIFEDLNACDYYEPEPPPIVNYAAITTTDTTFYTSEDGLFWVNGVDLSSYFSDIFSVEYVNDKWFVGGYGLSGSQQNLIYSTDGINWSDNTNISTFNVGATFTRPNNIIYVNNRYYLTITRGSGGSNIEPILVSTDGINWSGTTNAESLTDGNAVEIAFNGNIFVATISNNPKLIYSTDGLVWSASTNGTSLSGTLGLGVTTDENMFVASIGQTFTDNSNDKLVYSYDGITWSASTNSGLFFRPRPVSYGNGVFIAGRNSVTQTTSLTTPQIIYSTDGITWSGSSNSTTIFNQSSILNQILDIIFDGTNFFAVFGGLDSNKIAYSPDGDTWFLTTNGTSIFSQSVIRSIASKFE
jgi:hypothetical protein